MHESPNTERTAPVAENLRQLVETINQKWLGVQPDVTIIEQCRHSQKSVSDVFHLLDMLMKTPDGVKPEIVAAYAQYAKELLLK